VAQITKRKSDMTTAEKEKAATNLSIKLKKDLPPNIVFAWDDNYVLTFTTNGKLLYKYYYDNHLPNESDSEDLVATVKVILKRLSVNNRTDGEL